MDSFLLYLACAFNGFIISFLFALVQFYFAIFFPIWPFFSILNFYWLTSESTVYFSFTIFGVDSDIQLEIIFDMK